MPRPWPGLLGPSPTTGILRADPADFEVEEIPAYLPSGRGDHLFLYLEKTGWTTEAVIGQLARQLDVPRQAIGSAGLKDRHAVTRQWLSVPAQAEAGLGAFSLDGVRILSSARHGNKLKTGHLRGNRFRIRIRSLSEDGRGDVQDRIDTLRRRGLPNYFGPQRFGRGGDNAARGREILAGRGPRVDKRKLRLLISAAQSALFNDLLARRIEAGLFDRALAGDLLIKADSGGRFLCEDPAVDQARLDRQEVHPSGPMFGPKMLTAQGQPGAMEDQVLAESGLSLRDFGRFAKLARGTRRPLRVSAQDLQGEFEGDALELRFSLPAGSYATVLLDELVDWREAAD